MKKNICIIVFFLISIFVSGCDLNVMEDAIDNGNNSKLKLVEYKTGFYDNYGGTLPAVIMKIKNISNETFSNDLSIKAVFIDNKKGVEIGNKSEWFEPLDAGISRQIILYPLIIYSYSWAKIKNSNIICRIYQNNVLYTEIQIENNYLKSDKL